MARRAKAPPPSEPEAEEETFATDEPLSISASAQEPEMEALPAPQEEPDVAPRAASSDVAGRRLGDIPPVPPPSPSPEVAYPAPSGPSFGQRVAGFFRFLFRLVLLLVALALIGVALYYVIPWFYQSFVRPVERNTAELGELQTWQQQAVMEIADLQTKLQTLQDVQNAHDQSLNEVNQRLGDIESEINARTESLAAIEHLQDQIQEQAKADSAKLERQIGLLKAMELLSRGRLFMYQSNFGLAEQDVQIARDLLATLRPEAPAPLASDLDAVIVRLDLTLANLPEFPVAASDDLDIAWQILLTGMPVATPTSVASPTLVVTFSPTSVATGATATPTLVGTPEATATP